MTTIAFDGKIMAGDTLTTDYYGMIEESLEKVKVGKDFLCGGAGEIAQINKWWKKVKEMTFLEVIEYGYPDYKKDDNDPSIIIADKNGVWRHTGGIFLKCSREFHAVGSGRDYALAAMHLGNSATESVLVAASFDNGTNKEIISHSLESQ